MSGSSGASSPEDLVRAVRAAGVTDEPVLEAIRSTPRAVFVPAAHRAAAYRDTPIPITHGQVTTQPSLSAMMIAAVGLTGRERVLEVGTGFGFQTALLARLAAHVVSVERWSDMAEQARRGLAEQCIGNVEIVVGDGTHGMAARAPYDAVVVSAAFPRVPPPLVDQLRTGGRLVQPIGPGGEEEVELYERGAHGLVHRRTITSACFVRLYGEYGYPADRSGT
ncbi:protein-L-isoaspartate(D-aspartate) O-methyltransferase [Streptomyces sp. RB6PN25]|uniref:Protein-L-isoaspartate O-methyltransferase n=1 Tax=Streptomyces humicola TaxID=2953240 RepID=A0ABT1PXG7_9ACTN|nr:protein-L-isoaspartate(D-aspartate) O-methyltransferase [Streptomyces humicola]MCQ4082364.1 protein-L-isoaspartate(D-aspartate) O-methyltransferase [Streptomyces humicola]